MDPNATAPAAIAPVHVPLAAWFAAVVAVSLLYLVLQESGVLLEQGWVAVHELFHDGRHVFGAPCH